jgi:hypothetical protein
MSDSETNSEYDSELDIELNSEYDSELDLNFEFPDGINPDNICSNCEKIGKCLCKCETCNKKCCIFCMIDQKELNATNTICKKCYTENIKRIKDLQCEYCSKNWVYNGSCSCHPGNIIKVCVTHHRTCKRQYCTTTICNKNEINKCYEHNVYCSVCHNFLVENKYITCKICCISVCTDIKCNYKFPMYKHDSDYPLLCSRHLNFNQICLNCGYFTKTKCSVKDCDIMCCYNLKCQGSKKPIRPHNPIEGDNILPVCDKHSENCDMCYKNQNREWLSLIVPIKNYVTSGYKGTPLVCDECFTYTSKILFELLLVFNRLSNKEDIKIPRDVKMIIFGKIYDDSCVYLINKKEDDLYLHYLWFNK